MKELFSVTGQRVLQSLSFTRALYAFDFDGTLSPIVGDPDAARASRENELLLGRLSRRCDVAIVSGRSVADLTKRVSVRQATLIGNHGVEGIDVNRKASLLARSMCQRWRTQLQRSWAELKEGRGVKLEDKTYSIALHYRASRNKRTIRQVLFSLIERLDPSPRLILGKCVMNLVPPGAPHKGVALLELMMRLRSEAAFYIGDDDTDEDVFCLPDSRIITARVGMRRTSQAQFFVRRQSDVTRVLRQLVKLHDEEGR